MEKITNENFNEVVLKAKGVFLVDFWADWCGPCKMLLPVVEQVKDEITGKAEVVKVNVDECEDIALKYDVMTIPTLIVFKDGEEKERSVGMRNKTQIIQMMEKYL